MAAASPPSSAFWEVFGPYTASSIARTEEVVNANRLAGGIVKKPPASQFILIPQRPYLCLGTLRDQIIYPQNQKEMAAREFILNLMYSTAPELFSDRQRDRRRFAQDPSPRPHGPHRRA